MTDTLPREAATDYLVVVGASAGGVEALSRFVASLPADLSVPVVIAQHLDPDRPSHLADILSRHTALPVRSVDVLEPLEPGVVYVVPANRHVIISDHHVDVHADATRRPTPSVDLLLASAAAVFGERLIAVILTGSGSDGAAGAHAVKEAGGTVIIQDPATAAFPAMPRSLAPSLVDFSAPVERIGPLLADLVNRAEPELATTDPDTGRLLARLRARHGIDFGAYKTPTIARRLRRRLAAAATATVAEYLRYLDEHPEEEQRLIADFLIKVTRFFRDEDLFARLREAVIPELAAAARGTGRELRIWSAGCATGEEAYSLALLAAEAMADGADNLAVRIFATDLDDAALDFARRGVYPASALSDVPPALVARHFTEHDGSFAISQDVRNLIVFGHHDLAQRPPFPRMDLIVCRNVLIYFTPELQRRALDIFAYSLREDGYLVLGKSETIGRAADAFVAVDRRLRLYRRHGPRATLPPALRGVQADPMGVGGAPSGRSSSVLEVALRQAEDATSDARRLGERAEELVRRLPVGLALVTRTYDLQTINGAARQLLGIHGSALGQDLIHLVSPTISAPLRAAIDAVLRGEPAHELPPVAAESATGETRFLRLSCHPEQVDPSGEAATVLVLVDDVTSLVAAERASTAAAAEQAAAAAAARETLDRLARANRELLDANRELADTVDRLREQGHELRSAIAAAQVSSEEIETLNEELQSSNEELETLHEEAQATVEELNVSNDELQARARELEELATTHAMEQERLSALLAGMGDAVLVVDRQGRAVRTNAAYDDLLRSLGGQFVPADEHGVPLPEHLSPMTRAARGAAFRLEFTVGAKAGSRRWFEAAGRPLSEEEAGVLVIRDITDRAVRLLQEEFLTWAGHELRTPLTTLQGYLQLAERRLEPGADERLRRYLGLAIDEARRQGVLIAELIDATRLHSGKLEIGQEPIDLVPLTAHTVELAQVLAEGQTIVLEADDDPMTVLGDAARLQQVLLNLLTNAITYAPGAERIEVRLARDAGAVELSVTDTGPGIPVEALETIFERFAQVNPIERPGRAGLGLGLYIAREIVEAHGGTLAVRSAPGEGATFTVRLPLLASDAARARS